MRLRLLLLAASLLAVPASGVAAKDFTAKQIRQFMGGYAKCVVARNPDKASEAILANVSNETILRKYQSLIIGACLEPQSGRMIEMRFGGDSYRHALADALVSRELADLPVPDLSGVAPLEHPEAPEMPSDVKKSGKKLSKKAYAKALEHYEGHLGAAFLSRYGECVVRLDPDGSKALALTEATSAAEKAQFDALRPAFASCLEAGQTMKFGMAGLRGAVAINYYRLVHAARGTATETAK